MEGKQKSVQLESGVGQGHQVEYIDVKPAAGTYIPGMVYMMELD